MLDLVVQRAAAAGRERYEVSAFAWPGDHCRHNLSYWEFDDWLGVGAGAHGKLRLPHRGLRQARWRDPATYTNKELDGQAVSNGDDIARKAPPFEFAHTALRLREGFALPMFGERTGLALSSLQAALTEAERRGLIETDAAPPSWQRRVRPTARGCDFLSDLQALFLAA